MEENPKTRPTDNAQKDPQDWVTGDEPMTGAQASYLKTLSEQTHRTDAFDATLTKAHASERIEQLKAELKDVGQKNGIVRDERGQKQPASPSDAQRSSGDVRKNSAEPDEKQ